MVFRPGSSDQYLSLDVLWELARVPGHAVEFWFQAENFRHASLVGLYPLDDRLPAKQANRAIHVFLVEQTSIDRESLNKPAAVRFLHRWPHRLLGRRQPLLHGILPAGTLAPRRRPEKRRSNGAVFRRWTLSVNKRSGRPRHDPLRVGCRTPDVDDHPGRSPIRRPAR